MRFIQARTVYFVTVAVVLVALALEFAGFRRRGGFAEHSLATFYSVLMLVGISLIAFHTARLRARQTNGPATHAPLFWRLVGVSFLYLALDEGAQIHEHLDRWFHQALGIAETAWTDRIDDLILLIYGMAGLVLIYLFRSEMLRSEKVRRYLVYAFLLFLITVLLDVLTNRSEYLDVMGLTGRLRQWVGFATNSLEEIIKLLVGATLLLSFAEASRVLAKDVADSKDDVQERQN